MATSRYYQSTFQSSNDYQKYKQQKQANNINKTTPKKLGQIAHYFPHQISSNRTPAIQSNKREDIERYKNYSYSNPQDLSALYEKNNSDKSSIFRAVGPPKLISQKQNFLNEENLPSNRYDRSMKQFSPLCKQNSVQYYGRVQKKQPKYQFLNINSQKNSNCKETPSGFFSKNLEQRNGREKDRQIYPKCNNNSQEEDFQIYVLNKQKNSSNSVRKNQNQSDFQENCAKNYLGDKSRKANQPSAKSTFKFQQNQNLYSNSLHQNRNEVTRNRIEKKINNNFPQSTQLYRSKPLQENNYNYSKPDSLVVTPQKNYSANNTVTDQKLLASQRRRSLIEKSSLLQQKLNRLSKQSISLTERSGKQFLSNGTPGKKYDIKNKQVSGSSKNLFGQNSLSKRLGFEDRKQQKITNELISPRLREQEGLKKISELNQKINNRLRAILKNYG